MSRYSTGSDHPSMGYSQHPRPPSLSSSQNPRQSTSSSQRPHSVVRGINPAYIDLNLSNTSASTVNLGGVDYPVGSRIGNSGLFIIGQPEGPLYTSSTSDLRSSHPSVAHSQADLLKSTIPYESRGYSFETWNWPVIRFSIFMLVLAAMCALLGATIGLSIKQTEKCAPNQDWWRGPAIYHIPVGFFRDSDADNFGDLQGISAAIDYLNYLGVKVVSLSHILPAVIPSWDAIISYTGVDSRVGDNPQLEDTLNDLTAADIRVILELPLQYTSNTHQWFEQSSLSSIGAGEKFENFYIWSSTVQEGSWQFEPRRNQYYLHLNDSTKPLLNWTNPLVRDELAADMRHWLRHGVDGFILRNLSRTSVDNVAVYRDILSAWQTNMQGFENLGNEKILIVESELLTKVQSISPTMAHDLVALSDLILTPLELTSSNVSYSLTSYVERRLVEWRVKGAESKVLWRLGGLLDVEPAFRAALLLYCLYLPGTPNMVAGQEIAQFQLEGNYAKKPLLWTDQPYSTSYSEGAQIIRAVRSIITARNNEHALRQSRLIDTDTFNYRVLDLTDSAMLINRTYGRSDAYYYMAYFGEGQLKRDWSVYAPFGDAISNTVEGDDNQLQLSDLVLQKGQAVILKVAS